jgi:hypothetical protein
VAGKVFEGGVPEGPMVTGEWRRLYNEELYDFFCSQNIVRVVKPGRMRWAGNVVGMGERRGAYFRWGGAEGKRPLGRHRRRWIRVKRIFTKVGWGGMTWTGGALL